MEGTKDITLTLWQFDAATVATIEARQIDIGFLTLQQGRDASHEDDGLGIAGALHHLTDGGLVMPLDVEAERGTTLQLHVVNLDGVLLTLYYLQLARGVGEAVLVPSVLHGVTIDDDTQPVVIGQHHL